MGWSITAAKRRKSQHMASNTNPFGPTIWNIVSVHKDHVGPPVNPEEVVDIRELQSCKGKKHVGDHDSPIRRSPSIKASGTPVCPGAGGSPQPSPPGASLASGSPLNEPLSWPPIDESGPTSPPARGSPLDESAAPTGAWRPGTMTSAGGAPLESALAAAPRAKDPR